MKKSAGFPMTILSALLAVVGLVFYFINCNTNYFRADGVNTIEITGTTYRARAVDYAPLWVRGGGSSPRRLAQTSS